MANLSNINNKFIVTDGGNVLIGPTGNTSYRLDVGGNIRVPYANGYFMDTTGALGSNFVKTINDYETVIGTGRGSAGFAVFGNSDIRIGFGTSYTTAQTSLFINNSGDVGIGTDSPGALLHIKGTGDAIRVESTNTGAGGAQIDLLHYSTSPADNDTMAYINMGGYYNATPSQAYFSSIRTVATDISARQGELTFWTVNSTLQQRMVIDSSGRVGIGTSSMGGNGLTVAASDGGKGIEIQPQTGSLQYILAYDRTSGAAGYINLAISGYDLQFQTGAGIKKMSIDQNGQMSYEGAEPGTIGIRFQGSGTCNGYAGSLLNYYAMDVMRDQGSGKAINSQGTISIADGYGIEFGASQGAGATSTLLDDYEEGTWTPAVAGVVMSSASGRYVKIGNMVKVYGVIRHSSGASTSNIVTGLPFATSGLSRSPMNFSQIDDCSWGTGATMLVSFIQGSEFDVYGNANGSGYITVPNNWFSTGAFLEFGGTYIIF
jgi:hypothetical protein